MEYLKACFVGVGSIAKRHIKNLRCIAKERNIELEIDAYRRFQEPIDGVGDIFCDIRDVPDDYDIIFITNPTNRHLESLKMFHEKGKHFFIEKPVVSLAQVEEAKQFEMRKDSIYYVACPLRYSAVIQYIKNNVNIDDIISVRSISSSYLPDWRPGKDYRDTYSAYKDMGGGVSIDLIHEWDYLTYLFGWPEKVKSLIGKKSDLEIDSDDYAIYISEYANMVAELHLDYFGRKTIREIEIFAREETIIGDIANNRIKYLNSGKNIDFSEKRDDYQKRELLHFFEMVMGITEAEESYLHGLDVLMLARGQR